MGVGGITGGKRKGMMYDLLCRYYDDKREGKDVNYLRFVGDVEGKEDVGGRGVAGIGARRGGSPTASPTPKTRRMGGSPASPSSKRYNVMERGAHVPTRHKEEMDFSLSTRGDKSLDGILAAVSHECNVGQKRLIDFMRDFDRLRTGFVTPTQFRSCLSMVRLHLSEPQFEVLLQAYRRIMSGGKIVLNYGRFCKDVDKAAGVIAPRPEAVSAESVHPEVKKLLERIREMVRTQRIHLPFAFVDYDKFKTGKISRVQFGQALDSLFRRPPLSRPEIATLQEVFYKKADDYVHYKEFLDLVTHDVGLDGWRQDDLATQRQAVAQADTLPTSSGRKISAGTIEEILGRIRGQLATLRIRVRELMMDFDRLKHGHIAANKFKSVLVSTIRLVLSAHDMDTLVAAFAHKSCGLPSEVDYNAFCDAIHETMPAFEKMPHAPERKLPGAWRPTEMSVQPLTPFVEKLLDAIRGRLKTHKAMLKPAFQDYDRLRKGLVSRTQFMAALDVSGLTLSRAGHQALVDTYIVDRGVNYLQFLRDLELGGKKIL